MEAAEFRERLLDELRLTAEPDRVYRTTEPWAIGPVTGRGDPNYSSALPLAEALANTLAPGIPDHQGNILAFYDPSDSQPADPELFDRYIASSDGSGWTANHIYEWSGAIWLDTAPRPGMFRWIDEELDFFGFNGTEWYAVSSGSGQPQQHELTGELHTVSGTPGHVLRLVTANSAAFEALTAADVGADAAGSALAAITGHLNTWDHSGFLTVENAVLNTDPRIANWDTAYSWGNHAGLYAAASHNHSASNITSGTLSVSRGGTGAGTLTGYIKGNGTSAFTAAASIPWADLTEVPGSFHPALHAVSHRPGGSDEVFDQNLNVGSYPVFASLSIKRSGTLPEIEMRTNVSNYKMGITWGTLTTNQAHFEYNYATHELEFLDSSISYGDGPYGGTIYHTGNFDPSTKQPADATLTALAGLNTTKGFLYQTGSDAFTKYQFGTAANTVCEGNDSRLSDSREPINHGSHTSSYYVQGTTNRRSVLFSESTPMDASVYSTFFRLDKTDPSGPNDGINYYGLRAAHPSDSTYTTEIIGRIGQNRLLWGGWDGTRRDWLEIYHSGNFDPNDYTLTTDPRLSDARTPTAHASTHLYNGSDAITGEASFGIRSVSTTDTWSVGAGLGYGGIGIISNSGTWRQAITFTDAGADSHPVFSIITSKDNGATWNKVFNVTSSGSGIFKDTVIIDNPTARHHLQLKRANYSTYNLYPSSNEGSYGGNALRLNVDSTSMFSFGDSGDLWVKRHLEVGGDLIVGATNSTSNSVVRCLAGNDYNAGFEAYGASQGTGYLFVGQYPSTGGGIFYNGDGNPTFASGETKDRVTFYRRAGGENHVVFDYSNTSPNVNFVGDITAASMHVGTNEVWHAGNFNPADYTTTAQLQDWSTNILANQLGSYNAAEFTTVYNDYCDNIRLIKKELTSLQNGYAGSIAFGARGANTRHAAIAAKQTGSDANQVGLAFFTHAETSISTTYPMVEKMVLDHNGTLSIGASRSSALDLSADVSGNATISVSSVNNTITIKSGTTNALVINANSTSTLQSRSIKLDAWQGVTLGSNGSAFQKLYKITGTFANGWFGSGMYNNEISITSSGASSIIIGARFKPNSSADGWWMTGSAETFRYCWYNETTSKIQFSFNPCQVGDGSTYEIWILES